MSGTVTAEALGKLGYMSASLEGITKEQLSMIDVALRSHINGVGENELMYDLPDCYSIPGVPRKDAQLVIYSSIITSLEARGFRVGINVGESMAVLRIGWVSEMPKEEVDRMRKIITDHSIAAASKARPAPPQQQRR